MRELTKFIEISKNPAAQLEAYAGKKVIGCMPYFCPEELIHAAGMVPFGMWGAETGVSEAKRYLPAFICSLIQTTLELGIKGVYDRLSAVMIPVLCDSLKSMDGNWRYGVASIPVIPVAHAQNRKTKAGVEFTASQYRKIAARLAEISGAPLTDKQIFESIRVYNKRNAAVRRFIDVCAGRPAALKPSERGAVFKSGYFMTPEEYTAGIEALTDEILSKPSPDSAGPKIVTCGIIADNTGLLRLLDGYGFCVVDDVVTHESLRYRYDVQARDCPYVSLAEQIGEIEGCPVLYDFGKKRASMLADLAKRRSADGVLIVLTKFCDPEEYDIVPLKRKLDAEGIKHLVVEVDQQTTDMGQAETAIETFREIMALR